MNFKVLFINLVASVLRYLAIFIGIVLVGSIVMMCIFTPHKTDDGLSTHPIKYWLSDDYYCDHFDDVKFCKGEPSK